MPIGGAGAGQHERQQPRGPRPGGQPLRAAGARAPARQEGLREHPVRGFWQLVKDSLLSSWCLESVSGVFCAFNSVSGVFYSFCSVSGVFSVFNDIVMSVASLRGTTRPTAAA